MKRSATFVRYALPLLLYCALIFTISALSAPPAPEYPFEWGDKINHASAYAIMLVLAVRATRMLSARSMRGRLLVALAFCMLYGATDEIHQTFVPGRDGDILDWLADSIGAGIMALAIPALARMRWFNLVSGMPRPHLEAPARTP